MTRVLPAASPTEIPFAVTEAVHVLRSGQPVALPSETVYGLAANALDASACAEIFRAKARPLYDPLIVHIAAPKDIAHVVKDYPTPLIKKIIETFWPGPLTLILPKHSTLPYIVTAGQEAVAIRCTAHPVFQAVIKAFGSPLAAPSANRFGRISPTSARHVMEELAGHIPLILDGGKCPHGVESTILLVKDDTLEILRHGPVTAEMLAPFGKIQDPIGTLQSPGRLKSHYAPTTPLEIIDTANDIPEEDRPHAALLAWAPIDAKGFSMVVHLSRSQDLKEAATRLYDCLRTLDALALKKIYVERLPTVGLGAAIMERLGKAAADDKEVST